MRYWRIFFALIIFLNFILENRTVGMYYFLITFIKIFDIKNTNLLNCLNTILIFPDEEGSSFKIK